MDSSLVSPALQEEILQMGKRISELEAALRLVDDDVRHHLRDGYEAAGETIPAAMIRPRAIKAVRDALGL